MQQRHTQPPNIIPQLSPYQVNEAIAQAFERIAAYYQYERVVGKAKVYNNAAITVRSYEHPIEHGEELKSKVGIGPSVIHDINDYIAHGSINRLNQFDSTYPDLLQVLQQFHDVYKIKPTRAIIFYNAGMKTITQLINSGLLTLREKEIIEWSSHLAKRISRQEVDDIKVVIAQALDKHHVHWDVAGSYRRQANNYGDIDLLVATSAERPDINMDAILYALEDHLYYTFSKGKLKFSGIYLADEQSWGHQIDINLVPEKSWWYALMHATGSSRFNVLMSQRAIKLGYKLNQYGLVDRNGRSMRANSEDDIFYWLGVEYIWPKDRGRNLLELRVKS